MHEIIDFVCEAAIAASITKSFRAIRDDAWEDDIRYEVRVLRL